MDRRCEFGTPKQFLYVLILVVGVLDSIAYTRRLGNPLISQVFLICLVNSGHVRVPAAMYQWMALTYTSIPNWYFMWVRQKVVQKQGNPPNKDTETLPNWAATSELWFHFSDHHFEHHWLSRCSMGLVLCTYIYHRFYWITVGKSTVRPMGRVQKLCVFAFPQSCEQKTARCKWKPK